MYQKINLPRRVFTLGKMSQLALRASRQPITGIVDQLVGIFTDEF